MARKNQKREFVSGMGVGFEIVKAISDAVRERGGSDDDLRRILSEASLSGRLAEMILDRPREQTEGGHPYRGGPTNGNVPFSAPVVYVQPEFEELKRRFPAYVNPDYKGKRFDPIERCKVVPTDVGDREVAFEYVHPGRDASNDEVLAEMDRKGLRPALYEELLGFAEKYPDEQRKFPIVALGSETVVGGLRLVACLWRGGGGRSLGLDWVGRGWVDDYRFLAVRK